MRVGRRLRVFGYSLSQLVDGTREGFLNTCCTIHQGHYPCNDMEQYQNRKRYWGIANTCLGAIERKEDASADSQVVNTNWADAQGANNGMGWAPSDDGCNTAMGSEICGRKNSSNTRSS